MSTAPLAHTSEDRHRDLRVRMNAVADMLPRLREHLPQDLYGELCWQVALTHLPPTQADLDWARTVAAGDGAAG